MAGYRVLLVGVFAVSSATALLLASMDLGAVPWAVSRASGLASFAVLTASVVMGLLISTKAGDGVLSRPFVFDMHQFLAVASLALIGLHAGSLLFDGFVRFTSLQLVVPFIAPYKPVALGAGVIAAWLAAIATASFWFRSRIGQRRWRMLHYVTYLSYFLALGHGLYAGTDTAVPVVYWGYVVSVAAVLALTALRISGYHAPRRVTAKAPLASKHTGSQRAA